MQQFKRSVFIIFVCVFVTACTTTRNFEFTPDEFQQRVVSGDIDLIGERIIVTKKNGDIKEMIVSKVTEDRLISKTREVLFSDIESVDLKYVNKVKTAAVFGGTYLVFSAIAVIVFLNKFD